MQATMRYVLTLGTAFAALALANPLVLSAQGGGAGAPGGGGRGGGGGGRGGGPPVLVWSQKPATLTPYEAPNRPVWRLTDVLAMHTGQVSWSQPIVRDALLEANYVQMAPGAVTPKMYYGDDHYWFIVWDGQLRVTINGIEPFVASKGFMVQIPRRVEYQLATVGNTPALRFEVQIANAPIYYTDMAFTPPPTPGMIWYRGTRIATRTAQLDPQAAVPTYTAAFGGGRVYLDFFKEIVAGEGPGRAGAFVRDDRGFFNIIRGNGRPQSITSDLGHFHTYGHEFWFIPEGKISVQIEGLDELATGGPGDIITAVRGRFHRASSDGEMSTRIATNGYPEGLHVYQEPAEAP